MTTLFNVVFFILVLTAIGSAGMILYYAISIEKIDDGYDKAYLAFYDNGGDPDETPID